ncbi:MAG TPA: TIGR03087 family PEP-CTERM/XrtA system glycosyltransferase [Rhizomicrobium sp.]|nr:TIGR03087 family PEP-CTERM/XrtA system glycosyltransferase [Rhizomicrobium sp.]
MEVLFLSHRIPFPPNKGEKIRAHAMVAHLSQHHTVHIGAFVDDPADLEHEEALKALAGGECFLPRLSPKLVYPMGLAALMRGGPITTSYFGNAAMKSWIGQLLAKRRIDCAVVFGSAMAPYMMNRSDFDPSKVVLDLVDVDSDKWRQYAQAAVGPKRWIYEREADTLLELERAAAAHFGATLLVSPYEVQTFERLAPESVGSIHSVANGVDFSFFSSDHNFPNPYPKNEIPLVMTGAMDYHPNVDGAYWFAKFVMPLVSARLPNARFYVVGSKPARALTEAGLRNTVITGRVADVRPYIAHAAASVAPLRIARGVQNKVLEAMAHEKPVVATTAASRALAARPGRDFWLADDPDMFADAVIAAAMGPERALVAANGRRYVESYHDWSRNLASLDALLETAAGKVNAVTSLHNEAEADQSRPAPFAGAI